VGLTVNDRFYNTCPLLSPPERVATFFPSNRVNILCGLKYNSRIIADTMERAYTQARRNRE